MTYRTYREVEGSDRSRLAEQVGEQRNRVVERLAGVERVIPVMSGKGGVGKSYVTAALALELARRYEGRVGVLDADLTGPTVVRMLDAHGPLKVDADGVEPATGKGGVRVMSMGLLLESGQPLKWREPDSEQFVWRGTLEAGTLREFLADVKWGSLGFLLVDLPPGAASIANLANLVSDVAGAIAVTIPSEESGQSVERAIRSAIDCNVDVVGIVENMCSYVCSDCGHSVRLFEGSAGLRLSEEFELPLLAQIPFVPGQASTGAIGTLADALIENLS